MQNNDLKFKISSIQRRYFSLFAFRFAFNQGQAALVAVLFFVSLITAGSIGFSSLAESQAKTMKTELEGKQSYFLAEAGQEDVLYRFKNGFRVGSQESISLLGNYATTTIVNSGLTKEITSQSGWRGKTRKVKSSISKADGAQFSYGVQVGTGGVTMSNTSSVKGNLFSNGSVTGSNSNVVYGDIISAGATGVIDGVHATGTAYAHTIRNSSIDKDAHYQVISNTTVSGTSYPGSQDLSSTTLPIGDALIGEWEGDAAAGGIITSPCPYKIKEDVTIGPVKISCDLEISGSPTITLSGAIWVAGNITIKNSPTIRVNPAMGGVSLPIIADNPGDRLTSSTINSDNSSVFQGSGSLGSYVTLLSQNKSAETGGNEKAIIVANSAQGDLLIYAGHGEIELKNSIKLKEVTGYKISIENSAQVIYSSGLASTFFETGPGGSYNILDWREIE